MDSTESTLQGVARLTIAGRHGEAIAMLAAVENVSASSIVAHPYIAAGLAKLATDGGAPGCTAFRTALLRSGAVIPTRGDVAPEALTGLMFGTAVSRAHEARRAGIHAALITSFEIATALPHADDDRAAQIAKVFDCQLRHALKVQGQVLERHRRLSLPELLTSGAQNTLLSVVGALTECRTLDMLLRVLGTSAGYPTLGPSMLATVGRVAGWPITATLSRATEVLYADTITQWFLEAELRRDFTTAMLEWVRNVVCAGPEQTGADEPWDTFDG